MRGLACTLVAALFAGCVIVPFESTSQSVDITLPPVPPHSAGVNPRDAGDLVLDPGAPAGIDEWVALLNDQLALPYDVHLIHAQCGIENAAYVEEEHAVYLCQELLDRIASAMSSAGIRGDDLSLATGSAWLFVLLHETGHALIDAYDLPVLGREEDAADDLATLVLLDADAAEAAIDAAVFWIVSDNGAYSDATFADEHSLNPQRFYTILCTVYGSDPGRFRSLVEQEYLPVERAQRCPREYAQKAASWGRVLDEWEKV